MLFATFLSFSIHFSHFVHHSPSTKIRHGCCGHVAEEVRPMRQSFLIWLFWRTPSWKKRHRSNCRNSTESDPEVIKPYKTYLLWFEICINMPFLVDVHISWEACKLRRCGVSLLRPCPRGAFRFLAPSCPEAGPLAERRAAEKAVAASDVGC